MNLSIFTAAALCLGCATAAWAADASALGKDLKATIVLSGNACDELTSSQRNADSDYTATCRNGNRYRVFVNPQGRVVVQKL